jgi:hypothetical protein
MLTSLIILLHKLWILPNSTQILSPVHKSPWWSDSFPDLNLVTITGKGPGTDIVASYAHLLDEAFNRGAHNCVAPTNVNVLCWYVKFHSELGKSLATLDPEREFGDKVQYIAITGAITTINAQVKLS